MTEVNRCAECGSELAADSPQGLCPGCLLKRGLETNTFASGGEPSAPADFVPPTPAELAAYFPDLEILELLGRGGMGVVYKARQKRLDRLVALKILSPKIGQDPAFAERFHREARAMGQLNHPHIVAVHDYDQTKFPGDGGLYYFIMEYVDGVNLRRLLDTQKLSPEQALAIVPQICDALQYAHDAGVVHRDIKPENILIDKSGRVKIADFGLAKLMGRESNDFTLTGAGQVMGTPHYMAPEQFEHPKDVDHRADIYSLGVVFYQMLTGELPIGRFARPSQKVQIDVRLDEVVLRALEKEPGLRYQHVSEIKTQVETIAGTPSKVADTGTPRPVQTVAGIDRRLTDAGGSPPRFSRAAIVGAAWAPLFFVACMMTMMLGVVELGKEGGQYTGPPWWQAFLGLTLLALGAVAPFGTTILGGIALSQIRHSAGRLYGLGWALFDTLLFPLLALDGAILSIVLPIVQGIREATRRAETTSELARIGAQLHQLHGQGGADRVSAPAAGVTNIATLGEPLAWTLIVLVVAFTVVVDYLIIRWAWRAANQPVGGTASSPNSASDTTKQAAGVTPEPVLNAAAIEQARRQVQGPAIGLLVTGVLTWISLLVFLLVAWYLSTEVLSHPNSGLQHYISINAGPWKVTHDYQGLTDVTVLAVVAVSLVTLLLSSLVIFAALKMKRLQAYGLAIAASILAMIVSPSNLIGLPIGLWALVVLSQGDVRAAFGRTKRPVVAGSQLTFGILGLVLCLAGALLTLYRFSEIGIASCHILKVFPGIAVIALLLGILGRKSLAGKFAVVLASVLLLMSCLVLVYLQSETLRNDFGGMPGIVHVEKPASSTVHVVPPLFVPSPVFGPVIERTVEGGIVFGKAGINFETGEVISVPPGGFGNDQAAYAEWMETNGVNALGIPRSGFGGPGLAGFEMAAEYVDKAAWDMSAADVQGAASALASWHAMTAISDLPATYLFKTHKGLMGILQIVDLSEKPSGVKIRYKLVRDSATTIPAAEDNADTARLKLDSAERLLKMVEARYRGGAVTYDEVIKATLARDVAAAELKGDAAQAAQARLRWGEQLLQIIETKYKAGQATAEDVEKARLARDLAVAEVKELGSPLRFLQKVAADARKSEDARDATTPQLSPPTIIVDATYPGASAQIVVDTIAAPIEQQVNGVEKMLHMWSRSTNKGTYSLQITFEHGVALDAAQSLVQSRVDLALRVLPAGVKDRPSVAVKKQQSAETMPYVPYVAGSALDFGVYGPEQDKVRQLAGKLVERLRETKNLTDLRMTPDFVPLLNVDIDRTKAAALGVSLDDVFKVLQSCLAKAAVNNPTGSVQSLPATTDGRENAETQAADIRKLKVRNAKGDMVSLSDMVTLHETMVSDVLNRFDLNPTVEITANLKPGVTLAKVRGIWASLLNNARKELQLPETYQVWWLHMPDTFAAASVNPAMTPPSTAPAGQYPPSTPLPPQPGASLPTQPTEPTETQTSTYDIQPDGLVRFSNTLKLLNTSNQEIRDSTFSNGKVMKVEKITDGAGRPIVFTKTDDPDGVHYNYHLFFNEAVPPGKWIETSVEGTTASLISTTNEPGVFVYSLRDSFGGNAVHLVQTHRLPAGAELVKKSPDELKQTVKDGRIELRLEREFKPNDRYEVFYLYRIKPVVKPQGPVLTYAADSISDGTPVQEVQALLAAINRRLNSGSEKLGEVTGVRLAAPDHNNRTCCVIEIKLMRDNDADRQRVERLLARPGTLEFRILANNRDNKDAIDRALKEPSKGEVLDASGKRLAWWVPVRNTEENSLANFRDIARRTRKQGNRDITEVLVVPDSYNVTGKHLTQAKAQTDEHGQPCLKFTFNDAGGKLFGKLTGDHLPDKSGDVTYKLGIILDGSLYSAPSIMSTIYNSGQITGGFTRQEVSDMADILNAGALPVRLRLVPRPLPAVAKKHLQEIAVAMFKYAEANGYGPFPPAVLYSKDGKMPYSWRVALLPFLGQQPLYDQYRFDEAWDSPHNRRVLERMPDVFRCPEEPADSTDTSCFVLAGPGTMFDGKEGTHFKDIRDGMSNTILLVEAKRSIPWTKPEDIPYDTAKPLPALGGFFEGGFHVVMADGSVHFLPSTVSEKVLRALISKDGGEMVTIPDVPLPQR